MPADPHRGSSTPVRRETPRARGLAWAVGISLALVALLLAAIDQGLRLWTERWLAGRLEERLQPSQSPEVGVRGFPFLLQIARGRFDEAGARMRNARMSDIRLERLDLHLEGVGFGIFDLVTRGGDSVTAESGRLRATIGQQALNQFLAAEGVPVTAELRGPAVRVATTVEAGGEEAAASGVGPLRLRDGELVFRPRRIDVDGTFGVPPAALRFRVALPPMFEGLRYDELTVRPGRLALEAAISDATIPIGPAPEEEEEEEEQQQREPPEPAPTPAPTES